VISATNGRHAIDTLLATPDISVVLMDIMMPEMDGYETMREIRRQPEFRTLLQTSPHLEQLRQRVIASHHLEAMEGSEVGQYVEHRLSRVGWTGENPGIDQRVYAELAKASGGIPRRINQILGRLLLMGAVEQRTRLDGGMLKEVLDDLARDTALPIAEPVAAPQHLAHAPQQAAPVEVQPELLAPQLDYSAFEAALAARDEQIAELQQAVVELAESRPENVATPERPSDEEMLEALGEAARRITALEARTLEQERTIRHTLTMLIEWIEADDPRRAAA